MNVTCDYCHRPVALVKGNVVYPHRPDLFSKWFWRCAACDAHVGCHPPAKNNGRGGVGDGSVPLGRLANAELRKAKSAAHAAFDPMWKSGGMSRTQAYAWLAKALGISEANCHIGMMDLDACRAVVAAVKARKAAA